MWQSGFHLYGSGAGAASDAIGVGVGGSSDPVAASTSVGLPPALVA
jgi:hypothetical protein